LETFDKFVDCLLSVCSHAEKTEQLFGSGHINDVISTHPSQRHILSLLNKWALLTKDIRLCTIINELTKSNSQKELIKDVKSNQMKQDSNKECDEKDVQDIGKRRSVENLIRIIPFCRTGLENHSDSEDHGELDGQTISEILFLLKWSLGELGSSMGSRIYIVQRIISWFWLLLEGNTHLQDAVLNGHSDILQHFLALYDCILSTPKQDTEAGLDLGNHSKDVRVLLTYLNQIFQMLFHRFCAFPQEFKDGVNIQLRQRLSCSIYKNLLERISRLPLCDSDNSQTQNVVMSFVLATLLGNALPSQAKHLLDCM